MANGKIFEIGGGSLPTNGAAAACAEEAGNKAWNLMRMASAGLAVPEGFVLPASWRRLRKEAGFAETLAGALREGIGRLEKRTGLSFGSARKPLLVSARSGSAVSMPGMLETVLDVGSTAEAVEGVIRLTGNPRLAWDCYRRFLEGYAEVVEGLAREPFEQAIDEAIGKAGVETERELDYRDLRAIGKSMAAKFQELAGRPLPHDPYVQLQKAAEAVFASWDAPKAVAYRQMKGIAEELGTAVTVQRMVFGNAGGESGSGVGFTRDPATGEPGLYLDFCFNGQGEDVVGGRHRNDDRERLRRSLPGVWQEIEAAARTLEALFRDAQDFEFTVQKGALYLLQSRDAKRTDWAALRIAVDLVKEGLIDAQEAERRLRGIDLKAISKTRLERCGAEPVAEAEPASFGVASGAIALDASAAERMAERGTPVILVRHDFVTSDIGGIARASGILTANGSRTSHAVVVARQMGKVCLVGCSGLTVDLERRRCKLGGQEFEEGEFLSLDGNEGRLYRGRLKATEERPERELRELARMTRGCYLSSKGTSK